MIALKMELRAAAAATAFLSRLPFFARIELDRTDLARGAWAFPAIGSALGCIVAVVVLATARLLTPFAAGAAGVTAGLLLTGALHLDGLADSADGLGGRTRERALEIMRDHAVGAYGAAAIGVDLILRTSLFAALLERPELVGSLAVAVAVSRAAVLPIALFLPYARTEPGLGAALAGNGGAARCLFGLAIAASLTLTVLGASGLVVLAAAAISTAAIGLYFQRRLGGITGDVLGATVELSELTALAAIVAMM